MKKLRQRLGEEIAERWFAGGALAEISSSGHVKIEFPTLIQAIGADTYCRADLEEVFRELIGHPPTLELAVIEGADNDESPSFAADSPRAPDSALLPGLAQIAPQNLDRRLKLAQINPKFRFDSFVVGANSEYCHATAVNVAEKPGERFNPVFVSGSSGLGKTHLMTAVGREVLERHPEKKVLFVTAEQFANEFIEAVQHGAMHKFRSKFRDLDVLLVDDIQFLARKSALQEEFFHTFNALINNRCQLVLTSDRPPGEIARLEKRLVSRLQWGVNAEITPPNVETRVAILRQKAGDYELDLDSDLICFLANRIRKNVRRLEGALARISSLASMCSDLRLEQVENFLTDLLADEGVSGLVTIDNVQQEVANYFDVGIGELTGRSRTATIVQPRQLAMYLSRELTQASLKEIGSAFGGRDHGTVVAAWRKINDGLESKGDVCRMVDFLKAKLIQ